MMKNSCMAQSQEGDGKVSVLPPERQKQILPHLVLFCLKASHKYDLSLSAWKPKMRISKLEVRESCRGLTLDSHLHWTCEGRI